MSIEIPSDARREHLERQRAVVMQRLTRVIDVLDRKRRAVTGAWPRWSPARPAAPTSEDGHRAAIIAGGALLGGALFAVYLAVERQRRERHDPLLRLGRAFARLSTPAAPSLMKRLASEAAGSLLSMAASELGRVVVRRLGEERPAEARDLQMVQEPLPAPPIVDFT